MNIQPETPVGTIVAERLGRARVFERLGIDYCCHGATPLAEACAQRSLDLHRVLAELARSDARTTFAPGEEGTDFESMSLTDLADHIVGTHHAYLRREFPWLAKRIDKVVAAHAAHHPELVALREVFAMLRSELELHMLKEEKILFPLIRQTAAALALDPSHLGTVRHPIRAMEHEHDDTGAALRRLRALTGDYQPPSDACATFRAVYEALAQLESDVHHHIHKENNILFPKAVALEAVQAGARATG